MKILLIIPVMMLVVGWIEFWFNLNTERDWPFIICFPMAFGGLLVMAVFAVHQWGGGHPSQRERESSELPQDRAVMCQTCLLGHLGHCVDPSCACICQRPETKVERMQVWANQFDPDHPLSRFLDVVED